MKTTRASFFWLPSLMPDFQGTLSAQDLCQAGEDGLRKTAVSPAEAMLHL